MEWIEKLGRTQIIIGVVAIVVAVGAAMVALNVGSRSSEEEAPLMVNAIRAQLIQEAEYFQEGYASADWAPRQPSGLNATAVPWKTNPGYTKLGFTPELTELRGAYRVIITDSGFRVEGRIDVNGTGEQIVWEATEESPATKRAE
jgi:hypothetical protein